MTATRWWVRAFARWQARIDSVKGQIQAVSLAVTAFSTFSLVLQNAGLGGYVAPLGIVLAVSGPAYAYLFFEGGVWNQVARDRQDMSNNFAAPSSYIRSEMIARGLLAGQKGESLTAEEREAIETEVGETFADRRDGIELDGARGDRDA